MNIVIFVTASGKEEADKIADRLVKEKLAACVNIINGVESVFWWENKIDRASEVLLVIKSSKEKFAQISETVKALHSYEVPEIIALPITDGYKPYMDWINESIRKPS